MQHQIDSLTHENQQLKAKLSSHHHQTQQRFEQLNKQMAVMMDAMLELTKQGSAQQEGTQTILNLDDS